MLEVDTEITVSRTPSSPSAALPGGSTGRPDWIRRWERTLWLLDLVAIAVAIGIAAAVRATVSSPVVAQSEGPNRSSYATACILLLATWMSSLSLHMSRDRRISGTGPEEYKRVVTATVRLFGVFAILAFLGQADFTRSLVAVAFPSGVVLLVTVRWLARKWLHRQRKRGGWSHRVLVVGSRDNVAHLAAELTREAYAGFEVVGVCVPGGAEVPDANDTDGPLSWPVVGSLTTIPDAVRTSAADTVAVVPSVGLTPAALRRLGWALEGSGADLVVAPALTDVAGPRVHVRPVAGLPLLHVEAPQYEGPMRVAKGVFDRCVALAMLLLLSPLLIAIAVAVRTTSSGPALFRQERVGRDGHSFTVYKFRSMVVDAEAMVARLAQLNENDGLLFKMREDPRVTRVGRWIRRYSLDELPQLINVLKGDMSLVGPRPPLPSEVANYAFDVRRRLLVKPGMTGLWQVSGRSDLSWEDTVRLDLYYVENWSMTADMLILWKTVAAVLRGSGAY